MKKFSGLLVIVLFLISFNTLARGLQNLHFYAGGSIGYSDFRVDDEQIKTLIVDDNITVTDITTDIDNNDLGWKFFGGIGFNDYLAIEGGYVDLGKAKLDSEFHTNVGTSFPTNIPEGIDDSVLFIPIQIDTAARTKVDVDGFTLNGVASYPLLEKFDVFGKAGLFFWRSDVQADVTYTVIGLGGVIGTDTISSSDEGADLTFGLGARYNFYDDFSIRAEWERYTNITEDDVDIDLFSVGLQYNF